MTVNKNTQTLMGASLIALALALPATLSSAQEAGSLVASLEADIATLEEDISAAEQAEKNYTGGVLGVVAALNTQTLRLTQSLLEARKAAEESGIPVEITVPAVQPNPEMAASILADIQVQQETVKTTKEEASRASGLVGAMALTRYETERLSLAQLRQAWYQAEYGIAFPTMGDPVATPARPATATSPEQGEETAGNTGPSWADANHPEIDYTAQIFEQLADQGFEMVGWWAVQKSRAEIDDTPQVFAINVSDWGVGFAANNRSLKVACIEQDPRVIFDADTYLVTDYNSDTIPVTVRIGDEDAYRSRWSKLTSSQGAGRFGTDAVALMVDLLNEEKVFLRLEENNGKSHDLSVKLAGAMDVFESLADACQVSLLDLGPNDYRAIQTMLNAGGYDAGTPDGQWGAGSRAAMVRYQAEEGLEETGAPNRETLERMGVSLD